MIAYAVVKDEDDLSIVGAWTNRDIANRIADGINKGLEWGYQVYWVEAIEVDDWSVDEAIAKTLGDYEDD